MQVGRHSINILMDKMDETSQDVNNLYNLTTSLATSLSYHQLILYIRSVLANLWDLLSYIKTVSTHTQELHRCSYNRNTFSAHFTNNGSREDAIPHRRNSTISTTSPKFHLRIPCISITLFVHMFWLPTSNFYSLSMYEFRIGHNNSPSTKFSLWIFQMVILLLAMISALNILELHKMKPWQWKSCHSSSGFVKKQMDSFVPFLHHFNHLPSHHLALQPCMPRTQPVFQLDIPYRSGNLQRSVCPLNLHQMFGY